MSRALRLAAAVLTCALHAAGTAAAQGTGGGLELPQAVRLALEQNLDLSIERLNPFIAREQQREARGAFDPILSLGVTYAQTERYLNTILELSAESGIVRERTLTAEYPSLTGKLVTGTQYNLSLVTPVVESNNPLRLYDHAYQPVLLFGVTQPLLRDFGLEVNQVRIRMAERAEASSISAVETRMLAVIREVETRFWAVRYAQEHVGVAHGALELAQDLAERLGRSRGAGLATDLEVAEAKTAVAARGADLARARADLVTAQAQLRLVMDPRGRTGASLTVAGDAPDPSPPADLAGRQARALVHRPELRQQEGVIERMSLEERLAKNNTQWRLDLLGGLGWDGLSGRGLNSTVTAPSSSGLPSRLQGQDTYGDSFRGFLSPNGNVNWSVGVRLQLPVGNNEALARLAQVRLARQQEELRLLLLRSQIATEVETAFQELTALCARRSAAEESVSFARAQLDAQQRDLGAGRVTVRRVLEAQDALVRAQDTLTQAWTDQAVAMARLDAAAAQTFETYRLVMRR